MHVGVGHAAAAQCRRDWPRHTAAEPAWRAPKADLPDALDRLFGRFAIGAVFSALGRSYSAVGPARFVPGNRRSCRDFSDLVRSWRRGAQLRAKSSLDSTPSAGRTSTFAGILCDLVRSMGPFRPETWVGTNVAGDGYRPARRMGQPTRAGSRVIQSYPGTVEIEIRAGFCDPDGELLAVLERSGWRRITAQRRGEVADEMLRVCETTDVGIAEAWQRRPDRRGS